ncbi:MAG TPA: hypothetical protein VFS21_27555 [Roseiflexaceae bacterium]|nr:hypothetical protein [Roseiflexaceae bacterium]
MTTEQPDKTYRVYYARPSPYVGLGSRWLVENYERGSRWDAPSEIPADPPALFTRARLAETHVLVWQISAPSLGAVYHRLQVDRLDPRTFAVLQSRLAPNIHSSLTAGDVVEDVAAGVFYEAEVMGWRELE